MPKPDFPVDIQISKLMSNVQRPIWTPKELDVWKQRDYWIFSIQRQKHTEHHNQLFLNDYQ